MYDALWNGMKSDEIFSEFRETKFHYRRLAREILMFTELLNISNWMPSLCMCTQYNGTFIITCPRSIRAVAWTGISTVIGGKRMSVVNCACMIARVSFSWFLVSSKRLNAWCKYSFGWNSTNSRNVCSKIPRHIGHRPFLRKKSTKNNENAYKCWRFLWQLHVVSNWKKSLLNALNR